MLIIAPFELVSNPTYHKTMDNSLKKPSFNPIPLRELLKMYDNSPPVPSEASFRSTGPHPDYSAPMSLNVMRSLPVDDVMTLVDPLFPRSGLAILAGPPDTGKSQFARQLARTVSLKLPEFLGFPINAVHNDVLYVTTEEELRDVRFKIDRQDKGLERILGRAIED